MVLLKQFHLGRTTWIFAGAIALVLQVVLLARPVAFTGISQLRVFHSEQEASHQPRHQDNAKRDGYVSARDVTLAGTRIRNMGVPARLKARAATFGSASDKGADLFRRMREGNYESQARFTTIRQLRAGWEVSTPEIVGGDDRTQLNRVMNVLRQHGVKNTDQELFEVQADVLAKASGDTEDIAQYAMTYNIDDGVAIGTFLVGPKSARDERIAAFDDEVQETFDRMMQTDNPDQQRQEARQAVLGRWGSDPAQDAIPELEQLSDAAFLMWQDLCDVKEGDIKNLEAVVQYQSTNGNTNVILNQALSILFSGKSFSDFSEAAPAIISGEQLNTPAGQALLGVGMGQTTGYMLLQHGQANVLGQKIYRQVLVWKEPPEADGSPSPGRPIIAWLLENRPANDGDDDGDGDGNGGGGGGR